MLTLIRVIELPRASRQHHIASQCAVCSNTYLFEALLNVYFESVARHEHCAALFADHWSSLSVTFDAT